MKIKLLDLKMSHKKKISTKITQIAIDKVPDVEFECIEESENEIICNLARMTLKVSKEMNNSNEVAITYLLNSTGKLEENIGVQFGTKNEVNPLANTTSYHMLKGQYDCIVVLLHNHPASTSFSLEDIRFFLEFMTLKLLVLVTNKGRLFYLVKNEKYDVDKSVILFNETAEKYNKAKSMKSKSSATNTFLKKCKKYGIVFKKH